MPSFTNFTEVTKSSDEVSVTWDLESPGVRPVLQVVVRWMVEDDRTQLPTPEDFPVNNTQIFDSPSQTFSCNFTELSSAQRYVVLIQGTNLVGTSNTFFVIETGKVLHIGFLLNANMILDICAYCPSISSIGFFILDVIFFTSIDPPPSVITAGVVGAGELMLTCMSIFRKRYCVTRALHMQEV